MRHHPSLTIIRMSSGRSGHGMDRFLLDGLKDRPGSRCWRHQRVGGPERFNCHTQAREWGLRSLRSIHECRRSPRPLSYSVGQTSFSSKGLAPNTGEVFALDFMQRCPCACATTVVGGTKTCRHKKSRRLALTQMQVARWSGAKRSWWLPRQNFFLKSRSTRDQSGRE